MRRAMLKLPLASRLGLLAATPLLLAGCPQGAGIGQPGQDGGGDADADVRDDAPDGGDGASPDGGDGAARDGAGPNTGSGALCGPNGRDDCGAFLLCDEELGCVECVQDSDCSAAAPHCVVGTCAACGPAATAKEAGVSDCPVAAPACWASDNGCHPACGDGVTCPPGTSCDKASGACVGCSADADCASGVGALDRRKCVTCNSDATCAGARPRCRLLTGTCEACISNGDCGRTSPICDPATLTCRVGCSSNAQCPGQQCDTATARCVALPVDAGIVDAAGGG